MKKLLVAFSILGMVSAANATLQISVNGELEPVDSEILLAPSDTLTLDIWTDADIQPFEGGAWMLVVDTTLGTIGPPGTALPPFVYGSPPPGYTYDNDNVQPPPGLQGIWGIAVNTTLTAIPAGTVLYDQIGYHGAAPGDATLYLLDAPDGEPASTVLDTVVIHQGVIPEPMTIALLGLGGLLALRRRK